MARWAAWHAFAAVLAACASWRGAGAEVAHGEPVRAAPFASRAPLSAGLVTAPIGHGFVFGGARPDLFVVTSKLATEPGLFLYQYVEDDDDGVPRFRKRVQCTHPFKGLLPPPGTVLEAGGVIHGFFHVEGTILAHTTYDAAAHGFTGRKEIHVTGLPQPPSAIAYLPRHGGGDRGAGDLLLEVVDYRGVPTPTTPLRTLGYRNPPYNPFDSDAEHNSRDSSGIWRGGWPHASLYAVHVASLSDAGSVTAKRATATDRDIQFGFCGVASLLAVNASEAKRERSAIVGSYHGGLYYFRNEAASGVALQARSPLRSPDGAVVRHPAPMAYPMVFPRPDGAEPADLLVGGEGALHFYRAHADGDRVRYDQGVPVGEEDARLYAGSHPVPTVVDVDQDNRRDILVGNAEGTLLVFRNVGTNAEPVFMPGEPLPVGGAPLRVEPGYSALEGPAEAIYGYTAPNAVHWDADSAIDVVMGDALARQSVLLGFEGAVGFRPLKPLRVDGLPVHGPWRVRPGISRLGGRTLYVTLDDADELHAYFQLDATSVRDAGKLKLKTGKPIRAHYLGGGAIGRVCIELVDFDLDGTVDLLLTVPRHASVPEPEMGLPRSVGLPGGAVLFLKGIRTDAQGDIPKFKYPEVVNADGVPVFVGREDGAAVAAELGTPGPHLLVGEEGGRLVFYHRSRLSVDSIPMFSAPKTRLPEGNSKPLSVEEALEPLVPATEVDGDEEAAVAAAQARAYRVAAAARASRKAGGAKGGGAHFTLGAMVGVSAAVGGQYAWTNRALLGPSVSMLRLSLMRRLRRSRPADRAV